MGKSSLILRVENQAKKQGYDTAWIDFQYLDESDLESLEKFLKWFCISVTKKVGLSSQSFKEYWDSDLFGPKDNCDGYFREVLLAKRTNPLVLILEEVDKIFPYNNIAKGFFALLRAWHEAAKRREKGIDKLRLVLVYSTESYVVMESNSSPFNVGIPINLPEFTPEQVADLARRHGLSWGREEGEKLREMVGGHPYLVRLAFYHIAKGDLTLDRILAMGPTDEGIYRQHFGRYLDILEGDSELKSAFQKVVASLQPVPLEKKLAFKLNGLGLVNLQSSADHTINTVILRYDKLYRPYFSDRLTTSGKLL
jgi:serine/threonine-protein kinase